MYMTLLFALLGLLIPAAAPPPTRPGALRVVAVSASSALPKWQGYTFDAANLIDGRVDTSWQPAKKNTMGVGQWVELDLGAPHELSSIEIAQGLQKVDPKLGDLFCRNNRFAGAVMLFDDGTFAPVWSSPGDDVVKVELYYRGEAIPGREVKTITRFIRLVVQSVNEPVDWKDIAIAEIRVFGRPAAASPADPATVACDRPGVWPLRVAVSNFCAANLETRSKHDCAALVLAFAECRTFDQGYQPVPGFAADAIAKGEVVHTLTIRGVRHRLELARAADGSWSVKRHVRLDAAGKTAAPVSEFLVEPDRNEQNKCFEKLGKPRPDSGDEDSHEDGDEGGDGAE